MNKSTFNKIAALSLSLGLVSAANATDESFNIGITLIAPIVITETNALSFVETTAGSDQTVTTAPGDGIAATFTATGEANRAVTGSVVESSVVLTTGAGVTTAEQMTVDTFTTGGTDMSGAGAATFDGSGDLSDLRVGATANVLTEDVPGVYAGSATFRLVYN
jgi:hypothetical protein